VASLFQHVKRSMKRGSLVCLDHDGTEFRRRRKKSHIKGAKVENFNNGNPWKTCFDKDSNPEVMKDLSYSSSTIFYRGETAILDKIENRIEEVFGLSQSHATSSQILEYTQGSDYNPHTDCSTVMQNSRAWTVLVYLSDVADGGGTGFPKAGVVTNAKQGSAVAFESLDYEGFCDLKSLHESIAVKSGTKIVLQKWYHIAPMVNSTGTQARQHQSAFQIKAGADRGYLVCDVRSCRDYLPAAVALKGSLKGSVKEL